MDLCSHWSLAISLAIAMPVEKRQIFAKEWVGYAISLASIAIAKESLFGIAIAKFQCERTLTI